MLQSDDILLQNLYILFSEMTQSRKRRIHLQVIGYGDDSLRDAIISLMRHVIFTCVCSISLW